MTLNDIKKEVAHLGFESDSAVDSGLESAVKRALSTIYTEHGPRGIYRIYQNSPKPQNHLPMIVHSGTEDDVISLSDATYAFALCGSGAFEVKDENGVRTQEFNTQNAYVYGRVKGNGEIRFKGEFRYTVYDLCIYDTAFAEGDVPPRYGRFREYALEEYIPDFLFALSIPTDAVGKRIEGATIRSGILLVPYGYTGEISLEYRKKAPDVSINSPDAELDIPKELAPLVALLAAAYVWLDDDADKAQYYMSLYRDGISAVKLYTNRSVHTDFSDVTRWA